MCSIYIDNPFYLNAHLPLDFVEEYCNESFDDGYFSCRDDDYFEDVDSETPDLVADEGLVMLLAEICYYFLITEAHKYPKYETCARQVKEFTLGVTDLDPDDIIDDYGELEFAKDFLKGKITMDEPLLKFLMKGAKIKHNAIMFRSEISEELHYGDIGEKLLDEYKQRLNNAICVVKSSDLNEFD